MGEVYQGLRGGGEATLDKKNHHGGGAMMILLGARGAKPPMHICVSIFENPCFCIQS